MNQGVGNHGVTLSLTTGYYNNSSQMKFKGDL